jgi:hypothetical protein
MCTVCIEKHMSLFSGRDSAGGAGTAASMHGGAGTAASMHGEVGTAGEAPPQTATGGTAGETATGAGNAGNAGNAGETATGAMSSPGDARTAPPVRKRARGAGAADAAEIHIPGTADGTATHIPRTADAAAEAAIYIPPRVITFIGDSLRAQLVPLADGVKDLTDSTDAQLKDIADSTNAALEDIRDSTNARLASLAGDVKVLIGLVRETEAAEERNKTGITATALGLCEQIAEMNGRITGLGKQIAEMNGRITALEEAQTSPSDAGAGKQE